MKNFYNFKTVLITGGTGSFGSNFLFYLLKKLKLKNKSILIKFPKAGQDLRVDLPTLGLDTVKNCIKANIKGIAVKRSQNIILERDKIFNLTKKNNFFIISL